MMSVRANEPAKISIPNQPAPTMPLNRVGMYIPKKPNVSRACTGYGMPYLTPAWALRSMARTAKKLPKNAAKTISVGLSPSP